MVFLIWGSTWNQTTTGLWNGIGYSKSLKNVYIYGLIIAYPWEADTLSSNLSFNRSHSIGCISISSPWRSFNASKLSWYISSSRGLGGIINITWFNLIPLRKINSSEDGIYWIWSCLDGNFWQENLWRALSRKGIWQEIIHDKYMRRMTLEEWYKHNGNITNRGSEICNNLLKVRKWLVDNMIWCFGKGDRILIGIEHIQGMRNLHQLPNCVLYALHTKGIFFLD